MHVQEVFNRVYFRRKQVLAVEWQSTESDEYKELIRQLAFDWASLELPGANFTYADYITTLTGLVAEIQNQQRAKRVVRAILTQAVELGKSSLWVAREVKFETLAQSIGRNELLTLELIHAPIMDDHTLDLYNARKRRFSSTN